jgi:hypothetical protein
MRTASLNRAPDFGGLPERKGEAGGDVEPNNLVTRRERRYGPIATLKSIIVGRMTGWRMEAADPIADDWKFAGSRASRFNSAPEPLAEAIRAVQPFPGAPVTPVAFRRRDTVPLS